MIQECKRLIDKDKRTFEEALFEDVNTDWWTDKQAAGGSERVTINMP